MCCGFKITTCRVALFPPLFPSRLTSFALGILDYPCIIKCVCMNVCVCAYIYDTLYYFHYHNTRMGRGFRLGIRRKNEERKKKATKLAVSSSEKVDVLEPFLPPDELAVSIPIELYRRANALSISNLHKRMTEVPQSLPLGKFCID